MPGGGAKTPIERYPKMDWRAVDKVAAWRVFRRKMTIIFIADGIPTEQRYAKVLVAGGNEAFNRWDVIEPLMKADNKDPAEDIDAFWDYFEKSFEQTASPLALCRPVSFRFQARARRVNSRPGSPYP